MSQARLALEIAEGAHKGQLDKSGQAYILHPTRVGASFNDDELRAIGFLHDVVEDTDVTLDGLRDLFTPRIVDAVDALTRREFGSEKEPYVDFIYRCAANPAARQVKIADIRDNLRPGYSSESLRKRYMDALGILLG